MDISDKAFIFSGGASGPGRGEACRLTGVMHCVGMTPAVKAVGHGVPAGLALATSRCDD